MRNGSGLQGLMMGFPIRGAEVPIPDREGFRFVIMGPPGAGKSVQAALLAERLGTRTVVADEFSGDERSGACDAGIGSEDGVRSMLERLSGGRDEWVDCREGFSLLGFPRFLAEAKALDAFLRERGAPLTAVLNFELPPEWLVYRMSHRRVCSQCGMTYPWNCRPRIPEGGKCVCCGGGLIHRKDYAPESLRRQLSEYAESIAPLLEYYNRAGLLLSVEAEGSPEEVFQRMEFKLLNALPALGLG